MFKIEKIPVRITSDKKALDNPGIHSVCFGYDATIYAGYIFKKLVFSIVVAQVRLNSFKNKSYPY